MHSTLRSLHIEVVYDKISGCDTGFGLKLAIELRKKGFTVIAGCLLKDVGGEGAKELEAVAQTSKVTNQLHVIQLDVTKEEDWKDAVTFIK